MRTRAETEAERREEHFMHILKKDTNNHPTRRPPTSAFRHTKQYPQHRRSILYFIKSSIAPNKIDSRSLVLYTRPRQCSRRNTSGRHASRPPSFPPSPLNPTPPSGEKRRMTYHPLLRSTSFDVHAWSTPMLPFSIPLYLAMWLPSRLPAEEARLRSLLRGLS